MEKTKVVVAQPKSRSLRTTIPASIARILGIEEGTELGWDLQARDNQFVLEVRVLGAADRNTDRKEPRKRSRA
jgi:bifunctional DNA-binding transcriptional regulator/antitoxin component of YhaV-PrlF toxin-antitoxin module